MSTNEPEDMLTRGTSTPFFLGVCYVPMFCMWFLVMCNPFIKFQKWKFLSRGGCKTRVFFSTVLVLVQSWPRLSCMPGPFCSMHMYGICVSHDLLMPSAARQDTTSSQLLFVVIFWVESGWVYDHVACESSVFEHPPHPPPPFPLWSTLAPTRPAAWFLRLFELP